MRIIVVLMIFITVAPLISIGSHTTQPDCPSITLPAARLAADVQEFTPSWMTNTYSIVVFDPETGQHGVTVQPHFPGADQSHYGRDWIINTPT